MLTQAIAGQGVVRRIVLYSVASVGIVVTLYVDGVIGLIAGTLALIALLLLSMTDKGIG